MQYDLEMQLMYIHLNVQYIIFVGLKVLEGKRTATADAYCVHIVYWGNVAGEHLMGISISVCFYTLYNHFFFLFEGLWLRIVYFSYCKLLLLCCIFFSEAI